MEAHENVRGDQIADVTDGAAVIACRLFLLSLFFSLWLNPLITRKLHRLHKTGFLLIFLRQVPGLLNPPFPCQDDLQHQLTRLSIQGVKTSSTCISPRVYLFMICLYSFLSLQHCRFDQSILCRAMSIIFVVAVASIKVA